MRADMGFFFFLRVIYLFHVGVLSYVECRPHEEGKGPPGAPEPPHPQGVVVGARPEGPFPGIRACRGARGARRVAPMVGQEGLRGWSDCGSVGGGHTRRIDIQYIEPAGGLGRDPRALAACPHRFRGGCRGRASPPAPGSQGRGQGGGTVERWSHCPRAAALPSGQGLRRERGMGGVLPLRWCRSSGPEGPPQRGATLGPGAGIGL